MSGEFKHMPIPLTGKLITSRTPITIGNSNFSVLQNMEYTKTNPKGISGMTKINTTALAYPKIKSCFHFTKESPSESHVLAQGFNAGETESKIYDNSTAIPTAGDFSATALLTEPSGATKMNWSKAPGGNVVGCNGKGAYIWGGNEATVDGFINYDPSGTFRYDYVSRLRNTMTNTANLAVLKRVTETVGAEVMLLLHLDNNVTDTSPTTVHTVTNTNGTFTATGATFGTHCLVLNGTNAQLSIPDNADFLFSGGTFTIDTWLNLTALPAAGHIAPVYSQATDANNYFKFYVDENGAVVLSIFAASASVVAMTTPNSTITAGTNYHIELVESGNSWYIFINGVLTATATDADRAANYTGVVYIGYDGTDYLSGKIDEYRVCNTAKHTGNFSVPGAAYGSATYRTYIEFGTTRPIQAFKPYVQVANTTAGEATFEYFANGAWTGVGSFVDGSEIVAGKPLSGTGWVTFDDTEPYAKTSLKNDSVLYWYRWSITELDNTASIYYITVKRSFQKVKDIWDGLPQNCYSFQQWDSSKFIDYTSNIYSDNYDSGNTGSYCELDSMAITNYLVFGFLERMMAIDLFFVSGKVNTTANTIATWYYWSGTAWVTVGTINDGTSTSGISFSKSSSSSWESPDEALEFKTEISREVPLYYYKVQFSAAFSADVQLQYVTGVPAQKTIKSFNFPLIAGDSLWLLCETDEAKNKVIKSFPGSSDVFNGTAAAEFKIGDNTAVIAGATIYMQLGASLYEAVVVCKLNETWMIMPNGSGGWNQYLVDGGKGCCAAGTMKRIAIGSSDTPDSAKNIVIWQGATAIHMFDGKSVIDVSDDIADIFDKTKSYCINTDMASQSESFFDDKNHYHWCYASGSSTTLDKEWVLDTEKLRWYEMTRGTGKALQCGTQCLTTTGDKYAYGGILAGYLERLNYGTDFDGNDIVHVLQTAGIIVGSDKIGLDWETIIRDIRLICGATNTTTNVIDVDYYGDENTTAVVKTYELKPQKTGRTIAIPGQQMGGAYFLIHKLKFSMTTDNETVGFEPIHLDIFYQEKQQFLGDQ
jgi:hypothetical protein